MVTDREILWWEGFGWTDDDKEIPVTPETLFSVQSMSKNFTAAAVLAAVAEGLVDLDAPITRYLPDFTVQSRFEDHPERRMTLRLLLSHRAGFTHEAPDGSNFDLGTGSFENHVRSISRTWLRFPVGQRYCYSNLGVDLAGYILQVRSGRPFAEYVRRKILVPVGMVSSSFDRERIKGDGKRAIGHNPKRDPIPVEIPMVPSGGLYAGAADLARWVQFQLNRGRVSGKKVLPEAFLDEMAVLPGRNPRQTNGYGLGLAVVAHAGTTLLTHGGGGFGFLTYMGWIPEFKIGVVCLTNATGHNFQSSLPLEILDKFLAAGAGAKAVAAAAGPTSAPLPPEVDVLASEQERLAGRYLYASGGVMILEFENGRVGIKSGSSFIPARFVSPDVAGLESDGAPFFYSFLRNPDGSPAGLVRMDDGENLDFNEGPHDPRGPDLQEWEKYVGRYAYRIFGRPGGFFTVSKKKRIPPSRPYEACGIPARLVLRRSRRSFRFHRTRPNLAEHQAGKDGRDALAATN